MSKIAFRGERVSKKVSDNSYHLELCAMCGKAFGVKDDTPMIPPEQNPPHVKAELLFCDVGCHNQFRRLHGMPEAHAHRYGFRHEKETE